MKKSLILFLINLFAFSYLAAQDIHFSQFYANPLNSNPSNTGLFESDWRVSSSYRSQWGAIAEPYKTMSLGLERQFFIHSQKFSGGIYFLNDESGGLNLNVNKIYISLAYHKERAYQAFHIGLQFGWVFKTVDRSKMTLPNQFDNSIGYFNSALNSNEEIEEHMHYPDLNLGVGWTRKYYNLSPSVSLSIHHVLFPKESFKAYSNYLYLRMNLIAGTRWDISDTYFLYPQFSLQLHRNAKEYVIGSNIGYKLKNTPFDIKNVFIGAYLRDPVNMNVDALILTCGLNFKRLFLGLSYDVNMSKLRKVSSHRGALELAFIYTGLNTNMKKQSIPCDRF